MWIFYCWFNYSFFFFKNSLFYCEALINLTELALYKCYLDTDKISINQITAELYLKVCVTAAGRNDRSFQEFATVDWMAYQGAPDGGVAGKSRISQWWTGSQCKEVNLPQVIVYFVSIFWKCTWRLIFIIIIFYFFFGGGLGGG